MLNKKRGTSRNPVDNFTIPTPVIHKYDTLSVIPEISAVLVAEGKDLTNMQAYSNILQKITDDSFIEQYRNSLLFLYHYKLKIYKTRLEEEEELQKTDTSSWAKKERDNTSFENIIDELETRIQSMSPVISPSGVLSTASNKAINSIIMNDLNEAVSNPINGLETLIGREDVKNMLAVQLIAFAANPMTFISKINNFVLLGPSGVGKTRLGEVIAYFYSKSGLLLFDTFTILTAGKLVKAAVGATAVHTYKMLLKSLESIMFIDEAYTLSESDKSKINHGDDAINEIVAFIDKNIGLSIIIVAGYEQEMEDTFLKANQGIARRFPNKIILNLYTDQQLTQLLLRFISLSFGPQFSQMEVNLIYSYINLLSKTDKSIFDKQAGDMQILASDMMEAIYSSLFTWIPGNLDNNHMIILKGFNLYLARKNRKLMYPT